MTEGEREPWRRSRSGRGARPERETRAERRERRATVDDPAVVLEAAARFLEVRARSVAEVRRRLGQAGYRSDLVEAAIQRMTDLGMLDDATFARAWIESRDRARPRGEIALRRELALKGVERAIVDGLLEERRDGGDGGATDGGVDLAAAQRLLARHERALAREADPRSRRRRAYALLARNGFDPATCSAASADLVRANADAQDDAANDAPEDSV
ncbi:MAG TPA: regulatory protein RecX [Candidatus Limnocylindrales bacterium]|nr:regulatory protein RecX [Candidatus Limnocylindrales bacterium]